MKVILDTNIIFSCILNTNSRIGDLILNSDSIFEFYSVYYLKEELENHKEKLRALSGLSFEQIDKIKLQIYSKIKFIPEEIIPFEYWQTASNIVREVDMDNIAFVALSLFMQNTFIWTGDDKLKKGILKKGFDKILTTEQVYTYRIENE